MIDRKLKSQNGFSMIELLIVLVVMGIIAGFAIMALGNSTASLERQNVAKEFKISLERARFDSVKRRASDCANMSRVEITSATSFNLLTDSDQDGVLEPAVETRTIDFGNRADVAIVDDPAPTFPVVIRFNQRGHSSSGACGAETAADTPTVFCTMPCTSTSANASNSNMVFVSRTGTASFMRGGSTVPSFDAPTVDSVDNTNQINPMLVVWDVPPPLPTPDPNATVAQTATPTPIPTASPAGTPTPDPSGSPTPTPDPSVTPTATPSPSATPAPTATPRSCNLGEQPTIHNCVCSAIQYLQAGSEKCRSL